VDARLPHRVLQRDSLQPVLADAGGKEHARWNEAQEFFHVDLPWYSERRWCADAGPVIPVSAGVRVFCSLNYGRRLVRGTSLAAAVAMKRKQQ
jgi:hypothetical protein